MSEPELDAPKERVLSYEEQVARNFRAHLSQFKGTLMGLEEFVEAITPHVEEPDLFSANSFSETLAALTNLTEEDRRKLEVLQEADGKEEGLGEPLETTRRDRRRRLDDTFKGDLGPLIRFAEGLHAAIFRPPKRTILFRSVIPIAVSAFEVLFAGVVSEYFKRYPNTMSSDPEFSIADLQAYSTIEEAIAAARQQRIESLTRKSFDEWAKWAKGKPLQIEMSPLAYDWDALREVFEARHVIVHHAGRVSAQYIAKTKRTDVSPGDELSLDQAYVSDALQHLMIMGILFGTAVWARLSPACWDEASGHLLQESFLMMKSQRWAAAAHTAGVGKDWRGQEFSRLGMQCNEWYSRCMLGEEDLVRGEVESWDTSATLPMFGFVKVILLQDLDAAFEMLPALLADSSSRIGQTEIMSWPILAPIREDPRWEKLKSSAPATDSPQHDHDPADIPYAESEDPPAS